MDLIIQMTNSTIQIVINVKHRHTICLQFEDKFYTSLAMLELEAKTIICSTIKENLLLYFCKFSAFSVAVQK